MRSIVLHRASRLVLASTLALAALTALPGCGGGPSGIYEAKAPDGEEGSMTIEFLADNQVKVVFSAGAGMSMHFTGTYSVEGDKVTITSPDGDDTVLTMKGDALHGEFFDEAIVFNAR